MPWWGWLILACVVIVVLGWVTVVLLVQRSAAKLFAAEPEVDERRPFGRMPGRRL